MGCAGLASCAELVPPNQGSKPPAAHVSARRPIPARKFTQALNIHPLRSMRPDIRAEQLVTQAHSRLCSRIVLARGITVNLAPADLPKEGSHYDLPIALGLMAAIGAIPADALSGFTVLSELGLDCSTAA